MKKLRVFLAYTGMRHAATPFIGPPLGLLYLAGYLRSKMDVTIQVMNQRQENCSNDAVVQRAVEFAPDVVGLSGTTTAAQRMADISRKLRAALPDALLLLGGPHASAFAAEALRPTAADAAVVGEGELALEQILRARFEGGSLEDVPGLVWRNTDGDILVNPGSVPIVDDLDLLPFPAYDLIDVKRYWRLHSMPPIAYRHYLSLLSSRGCPYQCVYCHHIFGKKFRFHSAQRMVDEIEHCMRSFGVDDVEFLDDVFNMDSKRVIEFSDLIRRRNIRVKIAFPNALRTDILTPETAEALAAAGTYYSALALDSGSPRIQKLIKKNLNIPRYLRGVELAVKNGFFANGFGMLGFPTETEEEMQQTIDVICNSQLHSASFFTVVPFPNTELYALAQETVPECLTGICYEDKYYCNMRVNLSTVPDDVLYAYQRKAWRRFYLDPKRIVRIVRDHPQPSRLPSYVLPFLSRITKGVFDRAR